MFIATINKPYYPEIEYFEDIEDAKRQVAEWQQDLHECDGKHDVKITLAEVIESLPIKTHY